MPAGMSQIAGDAGTQEEKYDEITNEPEPATGQDTGELPPGWLECTDPEGNTYFFNDWTNESSWERPRGTTGDAPAPAETESAVDEAETESLRALSVKRDVGSSPPPAVSELDGMAEVPPSGGEEMAGESEASVEADADIINPEPAEAEFPGEEEEEEEEEVATLPEPWVELMTDAGEPYVSQVSPCAFTPFKSELSICMQCLLPLTYCFLCTSFRRPVVLQPRGWHNIVGTTTGSSRERTWC